MLKVYYFRLPKNLSIQKTLMKKNFDNLLLLIDGIPNYNIIHYRDELSKMVSEYKSLLKEVTGSGKNYNVQANVYHSRLAAIENNLTKAKHATNGFEKDRAYLDAVKTLKSDTKELSFLIKSNSSLRDSLR